ncbi:flagellar export chaperone FliS [bacterium]|nr:flagellar export chaperone FliS [bacterium]MBU1074210.1 flagellar export chaperone FliS [bacterium]MBU1674896.1 flagellar export chaperone FliS [bacterium]
MYNDGIRKYQETMIRTMGPERMIVMLYEGVVRHLQGARADLAGGDIAGKATHLQKAQAIVTELNHSLDHERNAEIAANLSSIYTYIFNELINAQIGGDVKHIDDVLRVLAPLMQAWQSIQPGTAESARRSARTSGAETGPEPARTPAAAVPSGSAAAPASDESRDLCVAV